MTPTLSTERTAYRFWSRVSPARDTSCWEWIGQIDRKGYGQFAYGDGKKFGAHRVAFATCVGPIANGMLVLHSCDNPRCVNPIHLSLGTAQDNMNHKIWRSRMPDLSGENNGRALLSKTDVSAIRLRCSRGDSAISLAREYGVSITSIRSIRSGRTWKNVSQTQKET